MAQIHWVYKPLWTPSYYWVPSMFAFRADSIHWGMDFTRCQLFHRDAGPCRCQCFPQLCQVGWCPLGVGPFLIHTENCSVWKNPVVLQFITHSNQCAWHLLAYPFQRHLNIFTCPFTLWMAPYTILVSIFSRLENPSLTGLLPFIYSDWSGFNKKHQ